MSAVTPEEREQRIRELAEAFASRLRQTWPEGEADISWIEEIAGELVTMDEPWRIHDGF